MGLVQTLGHLIGSIIEANDAAVALDNHTISVTIGSLSNTISDVTYPRYVNGDEVFELPLSWKL
jgi:hypothetical protein